MRGGHAYIDESTQNDYLVICSVVAATNVTEVRKSMRGLLLPNQRSLHMKDQKKPQRQAVIIETVCGLDTSITIYCAKPPSITVTAVRETCAFSSRQPTGLPSAFSE